MKYMGFFLSLFISVGAYAQPITFKNHGAVLQTFSVEQLKSMAPPQIVDVYDTSEEGNATYLAIPLRPILDKVYGKKWAKEEEALFTCLDGYQPSIPVDRFNKYESFLAISRQGSPSFQIIEKANHDKKVDLGPFYLVWKNKDYPELQKGDGAAWPFQLISMDLIRFSDRFPRLAPPESASQSAKKGFLLFRKDCIGCHSLNGDGGNAAPELNYPMNVTEYYDLSFLRKWISDPQTIRYRTAMAPFRPDEPKRNDMITDIIEYLKAMKENKIKPKK